MAFTNTWDDTQPPDTQTANLLGQDIRNLKLDIMQRMAAFGIGLSGSIQNPDASTNAVFGTPNQGVLYYAYDTGQIFQWNGSSWTQVVLRKNYSDPSVNVSNTPGSSVNSITIPANVLSLGSSLKIIAGGSLAGGASCTLQFNSVVLAELGSGVESNFAFSADLICTFGGLFGIVTSSVGGSFNVSSVATAITIITANVVSVQVGVGSVTGDGLVCTGMS